MNDEELRKALEIFKQVDLEQEVGGCYNCPKKDKDKTCIGCLNNAKDKLLDYITNLEEEIERQSKAQVILDDEITERDTRIDKAIEYIESIDEVEVRFLQRDKIYDLGIREYDIKKYLKKHKDLEGQYIKLNREKILDILKGEDNDIC